MIDDRIAPVDLTCGSNPVLRWRESGAGAEITDVVAYRVIVASTLAKATAGVGDIWDSGKVLDNGFEGVALAGTPLEPGKRYWASVRLWRDHAKPAKAGAVNTSRIVENKTVFDDVSSKASRVVCTGKDAEGEESADKFDTEANGASGWAAPATFGTWPGPQWQATPIWADVSGIPENVGNSRGWAFLRNEFTLPNKPILWATLYATGSSTRPARQFVYRMWTNGSFVGCGPVFPIGDEARVDGYDVTALLHSGANALGVVAYTLEDQRFAAQLDVEFIDGEVRHYGTGSSWKAMPGAGVYPDSASIGTQYFQAPAENIDSQHYPFGFDEPGFDDSLWSAAVAKPRFARLEPTPTDKLRLRYCRPVVISRLPDRGAVLDFGGVQIGGVRVRSHCPESLELDIRYGEVCNADGSVKYRLDTSNVYEDRWHIRPTDDSGESDKEADKALETWGMRVFRYVELHAVDGNELYNPDSCGNDDSAAQNGQTMQGGAQAHTFCRSEDQDGTDVAGFHGANDSWLNVTELIDSGELEIEVASLIYPKTTGDANFRSSNPTLNDVWSLCARTIDACNGNIYADSWTRERAPYEADAWIQQQCHLALDDAPTLARYTVDYLIANRTWPTEWPMYLILAVYDWWMRTGEESQIRAQYEHLKILLPQRFWDNRFGLIVKDPGESSHTDGDLVDWPQSERDGFVFGRVNTVINALASQAYADMTVLAQITGEDDDAELFDNRSKRIRKGINTWLYDESQGAYCDGLVDVPRQINGKSATPHRPKPGNSLSNASEATGDGIETENRRLHNPADSTIAVDRDDCELGQAIRGLRIGHCSLHASAFVLEFGQVPEDRLPKVTDYLRSRGMACSVYTAAVYLDGLYRAGYGADANPLIAAPEGRRTWGNMLRAQGGGTMEAWDSSLKPNLTYSHPWAASPVYLLPEGLLGIRPIEPGYRTFLVMPQPGEVSEAKVSVPVRTGTITVRCRKVDSGIIPTAMDSADSSSNNAAVTAFTSDFAGPSAKSCGVNDVQSSQQGNVSDGCLQLDIDVPPDCSALVVLPSLADGSMGMVLVDRKPCGAEQIKQPRYIAGVRCLSNSWLLPPLESGHHVVRTVALPSDLIGVQ
ncbi:alpha-L-rhamnosidase N-terminal domain-containing protein [Bifidobacterium sp. ESL0728]|uniref:alpha-L-rhamnosidase-related protein n=1 Tax=Bifidobacterium sp. ESL0728 TaxID=2983220 RepID=UPI0023F627B9|nr:alpha-L-rhamnosidase C-terminal domain-containing protein [Bifidobacterium sp. ESL0728]WEV58823.1 alpha-L-rhamnosidase N-terminal domain-containing protein [Bifidobacterium sp. ESL0728]